MGGVKGPGRYDNVAGNKGIELMVMGAVVFMGGPVQHPGTEGFWKNVIRVDQRKFRVFKVVCGFNSFGGIRSVTDQRRGIVVR